MTGREAPASRARPLLRASPLARRVARERGQRLQDIRGSGPGGRILRRDVEAAAHAAHPPAPPAQLREPDERLPPPGVADSVAAGAQTSWMSADLRVDALVDVLARLHGGSPEAYAVTLDDLLLRAVASAFAHVEGLTRVDISWTPPERDGGIIDVPAADQASLAALAMTRNAPAASPPPAPRSVACTGLDGAVRAFSPLAAGRLLAVTLGGPERRYREAGGGAAFQTLCAVTVAHDPHRLSPATCARFLERLRRLAEEPLLLLT